ncbi:MAG: dihydrolipoamide acetyltransferase family protein [Saprospiraceae bacterium]
MAQIEVLMPKMGESITEATIIQWSKQVGDTIGYEETLLEIATDKVDSEIPSPAEGVLVKTFFEADAVVAVGTVIGLISTEAEATPDINKPSEAAVTMESRAELATNGIANIPNSVAEIEVEKAARPSQSQRFYTPLVRSIATKENIDITTLDNIQGTGTDNRVTKNDILNFVANKKKGITVVVQPTIARSVVTNIPPKKIATPAPKKVAQSVSGAVEIIEMDRTRRLIADHMVRSKQTAPHVTSFVEIDVTDIVNWRNQIKGDFKAKNQENITFTPIFIEAVVKAIKDFPLINVSVEGTNILVKKAINIGMATALPSGNLIVPVIKDADQLSLFGLTKQVNQLANKARNNQLKPQDIQEGTFTLTNVGTFGNVMGTPIINQPQVAILSVGKIQKKPAVLETEYGDVIAVRHKMFLSLSYDHRVVDGMLGGSFLRRVGDYLEQFDTTQKI